jgi:hypothetical protein
VKMVAGLKGKEYAERCTELGLETLEERRQKQDMALVYKMTQDDQMTSLFEKARSNNHGARTRQATAHQGLAVQQCGRSGMFIPDPASRIRLFSILDPGSEPSPSRILIKEFKYFNPQKS